ncbi:DUF4349 domain-containing protein [Propionicimonas paludicola]|nr:DUF4349 domain-containing protein [Propionicimonas paludicola]
MKKLLTVVLLSVLALTGCSGAGAGAGEGDGPAAEPSAASGGTGYSLPDSAPRPGLPGDKGLPSTGGSDQLSPQLVRTAQVALRVPELLPAVARLRLLASSHQGQVTSEQLSLEEGGSATSSYVVLEVAANQLDDALAAVGGLGEVLSRQVTTDDVTTQVADIDARLRNLDASIARLTKLMERAGNLGDLASMEEQLTARQGERDSLAAQQKALAGQVARSTITVTLLTPGQVVTTTTPGFLGGLQAGWDGLIKAFAIAATLLGVLLPFLALAALIVIPILWWRHRRNRRRAAQSTEDVPAAGEAPTATDPDAVSVADADQPTAEQTEKS